MRTASIHGAEKKGYPNPDVIYGDTDSVLCEIQSSKRARETRTCPRSRLNRAAAQLARFVKKVGNPKGMVNVKLMVNKLGSTIETTMAVSDTRVSDFANWTCKRVHIHDQ